MPIRKLFRTNELYLAKEGDAGAEKLTGESTPVKLD